MAQAVTPPPRLDCIQTRREGGPSSKGGMTAPTPGLHMQPLFISPAVPPKLGAEEAVASYVPFSKLSDPTFVLKTPVSFCTCTESGVESTAHSQNSRGTPLAASWVIRPQGEMLPHQT